MTKKHVHPITIAANLGQVLFLVIIPVVRGFAAALRGGTGLWLRGAWLDLIVVAVMLTVAVWRWWAVTYTVTGRAFILNSGWLSSKRIRVPWERVATLSVIESFYLRPFRAARLRADTLGGGNERADFSILVGRRDAHDLLAWRAPDGKAPAAGRYVPRTGSILALALLTSNSLSGVVFLATLVSQSGRLLGNEFSGRLVDAFHDVTLALAFGLPPAAIAIAYVLVAGWLIAFLLTFLRYKSFEAVRAGDALSISGGVLTAREYRIRRSNLSFIDIRQSLLTRILRLYSLYISAAGYGKQKDDIACVIPTEDRRDFSSARDSLFPGFAPAPRAVFPRGGALLRFVSAPLLLIAAITVAIALLSHFFPAWGRFVLFVGLMSLVPALFYLAVNIMDFATAGAAKSGDFYTVRYSRGFYLHTVVIPADKIVEIRLRQSPIQQITRSCDLLFHSRAEGRIVHPCRSVRLSEAAKLIL